MKLGLLVLSLLIVIPSFGAGNIQKSVDNFFILELIQAPEVQFLDHDCDGSRDNLSCMKTTCSFLPSYKCDDVEELRAVARACGGLEGGSCIRDVCSRVRSYECDELSELQTVINICSNIHYKTIETICSYLPGHKCDSLSELRAISLDFQNASWENLRCLKYTCSQLPSFRCDEISELKEMLGICQGA